MDKINFNKVLISILRGEEAKFDAIEQNLADYLTNKDAIDKKLLVVNREWGLLSSAKKACNKIGVELKTINIYDSDEQFQSKMFDWADVILVCPIEHNPWTKTLFALNKPVIGFTSDFDLSSHFLKKYIENFDLVMALDETEAHLIDAMNLLVNPLLFGLSAVNPSNFKTTTRSTDVFASGSITHSLNRQHFHFFEKLKNKKISINAGYLEPHDYKRENLNAKSVFCPLRNIGTVSSRAYDALGFGAVPLVHKESFINKILPEYCIDYLSINDDNFNYLIEEKQEFYASNFVFLERVKAENTMALFFKMMFWRAFDANSL